MKLRNGKIKSPKRILKWRCEFGWSCIPNQNHTFCLETFWRKYFPYRVRINNRFQLQIKLRKEELENITINTINLDKNITLQLSSNPYYFLPQEQND